MVANASRPLRRAFASCWLAILAAAGMQAARCAPRPAAAPRAASAPAVVDTPERCASGPARADYVSVRADTPSQLAARIAACEHLGYRRIGGVARAVIANPGAASAQRFYQVMIVPAGAASTPAAAASAPAH